MEAGIAASVAVSLLLVIYKSAFPRITTLGRLPGTEIYRRARAPPLASCPACGGGAACGGEGGGGYGGVWGGGGGVGGAGGLPGCCQCCSPRARGAAAGRGEPPPRSPAARAAARYRRRSTKMYPSAEVQPGMLLLRIDAPIYFANVEVGEGGRACFLDFFCCFSLLL